MAYVPGCEHDLFISYSHANNHDKWVTRLHEKLEARLREYVPPGVDVFRDPNLPGNQGLSAELQRRVRGSAVFVAIVSRSYLERPWCREEVALFLEAARERGVDGRVFPIRYDDVSPAEFQNLLGGDYLGYEFFGRLDDTSTIAELDPESKEFQAALLKLRQAIGDQLKHLKDQLAPSGALALGGAPRNLSPVAKSSTASPERPVVFLAEPPRALSGPRDELSAYLREGFGVEVIQPGADFQQRDGFAAWYDTELQRADLFVQLLGRYFEPCDDESATSWDRWQYDRALACGRPMERWFNKFDKKGSEIDLQMLDADHRALVALGHVWTNDFTSFKKRIYDEAQRLALDRRQQQRATGLNGAKPLVVVRSDKSDKAFAEELGTQLKGLNCESMRVPDSAIETLEDFARDNPCNGLLFVYRACPGKWVLKRMQELRSFRKTEIGKRWACGMWKEPLDDDDPLSFTLDGLLVIEPHNPGTVERFVAALKEMGSPTEVTP